MTGVGGVGLAVSGLCVVFFIFLSASPAILMKVTWSMDSSSLVAYSVFDLGGTFPETRRASSLLVSIHRERDDVASEEIGIDFSGIPCSGSPLVCALFKVVPILGSE